MCESEFLRWKPHLAASKALILAVMLSLVGLKEILFAEQFSTVRYFTDILFAVMCPEMTGKVQTL